MEVQRAGKRMTDSDSQPVKQQFSFTIVFSGCRNREVMILQV